MNMYRLVRPIEKRRHDSLLTKRVCDLGLDHTRTETGNTLAIAFKLHP